MLRNAVDDLEDVILAMMDGVGHGFAPIELEWELMGGERLPEISPAPAELVPHGWQAPRARLNDATADGASLVSMGWIMH